MQKSLAAIFLSGIFKEYKDNSFYVCRQNDLASLELQDFEKSLKNGIIVLLCPLDKNSNSTCPAC